MQTTHFVTKFSFFARQFNTHISEGWHGTLSEFQKKFLALIRREARVTLEKCQSLFDSIDGEFLGCGRKC